jgi:(2R)-sulfolactate sulfo-lyase subunit alpha
MVHFLVHNDKDDVGVAVVDMEQGGSAQGKTLDTQESRAVDVLMDIPLGHKVALRDFEVGDFVTKYGQDIGKVVATIEMGEHVHTHNLKTKRW